MTMNSADLEILADRKLRELPAPAAPPTLLPRVLRAVQRQLERPWYNRPWMAWPLALQALSVAALAVVLAGLTASSGALPSIENPLSGAGADVRTTLQAAAVLRRALVEPVLGYVIILGLIMSSACAGLGAALARLTGMERGSQL
jgi:hypothetical protein